MVSGPEPAGPPVFLAGPAGRRWCTRGEYDTIIRTTLAYLAARQPYLDYPLAWRHHVAIPFR